MPPPLTQAVFESVLAEAKRAHLAGEFARARILYEDILARRPDEPGPQVLLAELDLREGRVLTAKTRIERVLAIDPSSVELRAALANVLEELGDVRAATAFYREETARRPEASENWSKLANELNQEWIKERPGSAEIVTKYRQLLNDATAAKKQ